VTRRHAAAAAAALALVGALAACSGDGGDAGERERDPVDETAPRDTRTTTDATLALAEADPTSLLVAEGIRFGTAPAPLLAALDAYRDDVAVLDADGAIAWDATSVLRVAEVVVLALDPGAFTDESLLDVYVDRLRNAAAEGARRVESFQRGNLLALLTGLDAARLADLAARMQAAVDAGQTGTDERFTPLRELATGAVFVPLTTARFDPYPVGGEPVQPSTPTTHAPPEPPPPPILPGIGEVAIELRQVVVAGEVRALAWALAVPLRLRPSAELLEPAIPPAVAGRAGEPTTSFVVDRSVWTADPTDERSAVRAFRHGNVVVMVEGADPVQLDALVGAWITALGTG
jgi:hypothetical protein